jgi:hypothetical protein
LSRKVAVAANMGLVDASDTTTAAKARHKDRATDAALPSYVRFEVEYVLLGLKTKRHAQSQPVFDKIPQVTPFSRVEQLCSKRQLPHSW